MISLAYLIPYRRASALKAYLFMTYSGGGGGGGGGGGTGLPNLFSKLAYLSLPFLIMDINRFMF